MTITKNIIETVEEYITHFYREKVPKEYVYHDIAHTQEVVRVCRQLGIAYGLSLEDIETLELAAWFHDTGYDKGPNNHEERSADYAARFLRTLDFPEYKIEQIVGCILATKLPSNPQGQFQQIICDADLSHLGEKSYWIRTAKVRQELMVIHAQPLPKMRLELLPKAIPKIRQTLRMAANLLARSRKIQTKQTTRTSVF